MVQHHWMSFFAKIISWFLGLFQSTKPALPASATASGVITAAAKVALATGTIPPMTVVSMGDGTATAPSAPALVPVAPTAAPSEVVPHPDATKRPYLVFDAYADDLGALPKWTAVTLDSRYVAIVIKASQGINYSPAWFKLNWQRVREAWGDRYGSAGFRGCYHFLNFFQDGKAQAEMYLTAVSRAGGFGAGDMIPILDIERGRDTPGGKDNYDASANQVVDCASLWVETVKKATGKRVGGYGRGAMADLGIESSMGVDTWWNPSYTRTISMHGLERFKDAVKLWQYAGDGAGAAGLGLPLTVPEFGKHGDISVVIDGPRAPTLDTFKKAWL